MSKELVATWLGRVGYVDGWRLQEAIATRVRAGGPDRLLLLEHDPVYTIGRRGSVANLVASPAELRAHGASAYRVDRGGDITYHGPGQLVGYPVVALGDARVRVSRGVSTHGFALNVSTDLAAFERMIPCGFAHDVASLQRLGVRASVRAVGERVADVLAARLGRELRWERDLAPAGEDEVPAEAPVRTAEDLLARVGAGTAEALAS